MADDTKPSVVDMSLNSTLEYESKTSNSFVTSQPGDTKIKRFTDLPKLGSVLKIDPGAPVHGVHRW